MFLLRTFGALELLDESGTRLGGAAAQRRPLLILALAALVPDGIPRERLIRILWPDTERTRARATLKQHLYALRRATGEPRLVSGSPRLTVPDNLVRVDLLELASLVDRGRLRDAAALLRGDPFEDVLQDASAPLRAVIDEIRATFAPRISLARKAIEAERLTPVMPTAPVRVGATIAADRELHAAVRRFVRAIGVLPEQPAAAYHRAGWCTHDLLEALTNAEHAGLSAERIRELVSDSEAVWRRSDLVEALLVSPPGSHGSAEAVDWLLEGGVRTRDPVGRALESYLLDSGIATHVRAGHRWETRLWTTQLAACGDPQRVLALAPRGARDILSLGSVLRGSEASLVVADGDAAGLAATRGHLGDADRFVHYLDGDPFDRAAEIAGLGPYDLILTGGVQDQLPPRGAKWFAGQLLGALAPGGKLSLWCAATRTPHGAWFRHIVRWPLPECDQDDLLFLIGDEAEHCAITWNRDAAGHTWLVVVERDRASQFTRRAA